MILETNYGITTSNNPVFVMDKSKANSLRIEEEIIKPLYDSDDISRYNLTYRNRVIIHVKAKDDINKYPNTMNYLLKNKENLEKRSTDAPYYALHRERTPILFKKNKIVIKQTSDKIIAAFDSLGLYCLDNILCLVFKDNVNSLFILSLLNSKMFIYLYNYYSQENGRNFAQIKPHNIKKLPIPNTTEEQQQSLSCKAKQVILLYKNLHEIINSGLEVVKINYQPQKITQRLKEYYSLGINLFIDELKKTKSKLPHSLTEQEDLIKWYNIKIDNITQIQEQIYALEKNINKEIYNLYELSPQEIQMVEKGT